MTLVRLLSAFAVIAFRSLPICGQSTGLLFQQRQLVEDECPSSAGCCEEDCCGPGTFWNFAYCIIDPSSSGFNGTHSGQYRVGCIDRVCCEEDCCGYGMRYDQESAFCLPLDDTSPPTCSPTTGPCISTLQGLETVVSTATANDVVALCGNGIPITTESAITMDQPNMKLCCLGKEPCILESTGNDRNLVVRGADVTLQDIIFRNGKSEFSGGNVHIDAGGNHRVIGCEFSGGKADILGGNIAVADADSASFVKTRFLNGSSETGGGLGLSNTIEWSATECEFRGNEASIVGGGAFATSIGHMSLESSKFIDNSADVLGGGYFASAIGELPSLTIYNCEFSRNKGGAAWGSGPENVNIYENYGNGNVASNCDGCNCDGFDLLLDYKPYQACVDVDDEYRRYP